MKLKIDYHSCSPAMKDVLTKYGLWAAYSWRHQIPNSLKGDWDGKEAEEDRLRAQGDGSSSQASNNAKDAP